MSSNQLDVSPIAILTDNYAWVLQPDDSPVVVVDPGEAGPVLQWLQSRRLALAAILLTHHHGDHVGGVARLAQAYQVRVFGPAEEHISGVTDPVSHGSSVSLKGVDLEVIEVPGHTAGHVAYRGPGIVFTGDALFAGGCGRVFEGTFEQMHASLQRLAALPAQTLVYCAHEYTAANLAFARQVEPDNHELAKRLEQVRGLREQGQPTLPCTISDELGTNPFLRCHHHAVVEAACRHANRQVAPGAETFAVIRGWKDGWRG